MFPPKIKPRPAKSDQNNVNKAPMESVDLAIEGQADRAKVLEVADRADLEAPAASVVVAPAAVDLPAASAVVPEAAAN